MANIGQIFLTNSFQIKFSGEKGDIPIHVHPVKNSSSREYEHQVWIYFWNPGFIFSSLRNTRFPILHITKQKSLVIFVIIILILVQRTQISPRITEWLRKSSSPTQGSWLKQEHRGQVAQDHIQVACEDFAGGDSTTSLGTVTVKEFFLIFRQNFCSSSSPLPLVLSLITTETSLALPALYPPYRYL